MVDACIGSINGFLSAPYTGWFPAVMAIALAVIAVLALFYILSPLFGRNDIKTWVKIKIFDVFVSIIFILIFASFATATCSYNPINTYHQYGLLPAFCQSAQTINGVSVPAPNNIYSLAICDMYNFNYNSYDILNKVFFYGLALLSFWPGMKFDANFGFLQISSSVMMPIAFGQSLNLMLDSIYLLQIVNQVQLILLSAAPLIFAIFMSIGLIARMFGITRTFGGAMIAFGIGLGFIYPLLVSINYGFIATVESAVWANVSLNFAQFYQAIFGAMINSLANPGIIGAANADAIVGAAGATSGIATFYGVLESIGLMYAGMLFIPILDFIILDAFIVDFSQAIGERMSFMSLVSRLL